ncbi:MAG: flagellar hook-length control protein FliK [Desulfobacteria bacterium]
MKIDAITRIGNSLTFQSPSGEGMRFTVGDVVQADVLSTLPDGNVLIRITTESGKSGVVAARSEVPLAERESVLLKVVGGEREVALRFLGVIRDGEAPGSVPAGLPGMYRELASELAASRLSTADARLAQESFLFLPEAVKEAVPGFEAIGRSPGMEGLDGKVLKETVEGSGILLETKLKLAVKDLPPGADRKEALLRLGEALRDRDVAGVFSRAGENPGNAGVRTDGLLSTIESFQLASAAQGGVYVPLSLQWDELADGEMLFRKRARGKGESYTCEINLDLRPLGKMSASVTMYDGAFFVSLAPQSEATRSLISSRSEEVERRFREAGLPLRAVSITRKNSVDFGVPARNGVDVEV